MHILVTIIVLEARLCSAPVASACSRWEVDPRKRSEGREK
jgi:hypothetical protein